MNFISSVFSIVSLFLDHISHLYTNWSSLCLCGFKFGQRIQFETETFNFPLHSTGNYSAWQDFRDLRWTYSEQEVGSLQNYRKSINRVWKSLGLNLNLPQLWSLTIDCSSLKLKLHPIWLHTNYFLVNLIAPLLHYLKKYLLLETILHSSKLNKIFGNHSMLKILK